MEIEKRQTKSPIEVKKKIINGSMLKPSLKSHNQEKSDGENLNTTERLKLLIHKRERF